MLYELIRGKVTNDEFAGFKGRTQSSDAAATAANNGGFPPRRKMSRTRMRPMSATSSQRQQQSGRPKSSSVFEPLPPTRVASMRPWTMRSTGSLRSTDAANDDIDAPTDVEIKVAELSGKIDKLMEIILAMQQEKGAL